MEETTPEPTPEKQTPEPTTEPEPAVAGDHNFIDEARKANEEKKALLDREEKLQTRKEKLHAESMVTGKSVVQAEPQKSDEEKASDERVREIGQATGANWAKEM